MLNDKNYIKKLLLFLNNFRKNFNCKNYGGMDDWTYWGYYKFDSMTLNKWFIQFDVLVKLLKLKEKSLK